MESSQVSWVNNIPYDDLMKQCPFLAQKSGIQLQPGAPHPTEPGISKSKKKRLKKRLKAVSNIKPSDEKAVCGNHLREEKSPQLLEEVSTLQPFQNQTILKGVNVDSLKPQVVPNKVKIQGELTDKQQGKTDKQHKGLSKKSTEMSSNPKKSTTPKKGGDKSLNTGRVADVLDGEVLSPAGSVNRAQVLADRDARKKAKQQVKQGVIGSKPELVVKSINTDDKDNKLGNTKDAQMKIEPHGNMSFEVKSFDITSVNVNNKLSTVGEVADVTRGQVSTTSESNPKQTSAPEKSREEILAEREAKKKAKQMAKLKKNDKQPELSGEKVLVTNSINYQEEIKSLPKSDVCKKEVLSEGAGEATVASTKSKAELRAERRIKQEAQRAAKEAEKKLKADVRESNKENLSLPSKDKTIILEKESQLKKSKTVSPSTNVISQQRIKLFSHLHIGLKLPHSKTNQNVHPAVIELGVKYSARIINGSNARCVALLNCLKEVIQEYVTPAEKEFSRGLESKLGELTEYLSECRPMAVSMTNALRHIKSHLNQLPNNVSDDEAKRKLLDVIDTFIREQIDVAGEAICETVKRKIATGDVILIYSCSSLLLRILVESHRAGRKFKVVVVDGGPWFEGREMLRRLVDAGLSCSYVQVSAINFIMTQATKVLLGAHALLANGSVMSRAGASLVALAAHSCNIPVLVCCETYKFCERVQTDAFVYNELGSPEEVMGTTVGWESLTQLSPLSLLYDITPPDLVTAVVTELAILPCTSVPVILRVKPSDLVA